MPASGEIVCIVSAQGRDIKAQRPDGTHVWLDPSGWFAIAEGYPGVSDEGASWAMERKP